MKLYSIKGEVVTTVLVLVGLLAATQLVPNWRLSNLLKKENKAPFEELQKAQQALIAERAAREVAEEKLKAAHKAEQAITKQEVQSAQQFNEGTIKALDSLPPDKRTKETRLARSFAGRVSLRLAAAVGKLPAEMQNEIYAIVDDELSEVESRVAEAERKLQLKDDELRVMMKQKDQIVESIPKLAKQLEKKDQVVAELEKVVETKTGEVVEVAKTLEAEKHEKGSLKATLDDFWYQIKVVVLVIGGLYVFIVWILPGLIKHMETGRAKNFLRDVSGYVSNAPLYHDAKKKIAKAQAGQSKEP